MIRTFATHKIRKQTELTGSLWEFEPCSGRYAGQKFLLATPECWESHPLFADYRGEGIFRKSFQATGDIRIECKGVSHTATVYLDGREIAHHYNAYTPFSAVVADLQLGEHRLEIKADNRFHQESALHVPNDYMSYGGVSRPVVVEELDGLYFEYVHVKTYMKNGKWHAKISAAISVLKTGQYRGEEIVVTGRIGNTTFDWKISLEEQEHYELHKDLEIDNVKPWSPEDPELYLVELQMRKGQQILDDIIDRFGFREICVEGQKILLNGKSLRIKGVCRHEDHPDYGCALPYQAIYNDIVLIQQMGANSIRTAHYPNDEIFLDLCDELGILVWEENHARGLEEDAEGLRAFAALHKELLVASSYSKNFGLYNERVGACTLVATDQEAVDRAFSQMKSVIRANYSNPPAHGASVVATILSNDALRAIWEQELTDMRQRIQRMRLLFVNTLQEKGASRDFSFISQQNGMFSFSGLTKEQVLRLREEFAIYAVASGRINVAGMTPDNMAPLCEAIVAVL